MIKVNGISVCTYKADFTYIENGESITEDVKGYKTAIYKLKKKLMKVVNNIDITEGAYNQYISSAIKNSSKSL